jgi:hypothetical protein
MALKKSIFGVDHLRCANDPRPAKARFSRMLNFRLFQNNRPEGDVRRGSNIKNSARLLRAAYCEPFSLQREARNFFEIERDGRLRNAEQVGDRCLPKALLGELTDNFATIAGRAGQISSRPALKLAAEHRGGRLHLTASALYVRRYDALADRHFHFVVLANIQASEKRANLRRIKFHYAGHGISGLIGML